MRGILFTALIIYSVAVSAQSKIDTLITPIYGVDSLGDFTSDTIGWNTEYVYHWEYPNFSSLVELDGTPLPVYVGEENGLKKYRKFVELTARVDAIKVYYLEWYEINGNTKHLSEELKEYTESVDRIWYWNMQLGYTAILPAINYKLLSGLQ